MNDAKIIDWNDFFFFVTLHLFTKLWLNTQIGVDYILLWKMHF